MDRDSGLYYLLEAQGKMVRLVGNEEIAGAMSVPPSDTRAYFRGQCLEKFGDAVKSINWDRIVFAMNGKQQSVDLKDLIEPERVQEYNALLDRSETLGALLEEIDG